MSRVAQWKRAGPITQRSEDQNLALLIILLVILFVAVFYSQVRILQKTLTTDNLPLSFLR